jgi:hypothetical protein
MGGIFDVPILPGEMTLAWAYGTNDGTVINLNQPVYAQHTARGGASVNFLPGSEAPSPDPIDDPDATAPEEAENV